MGPVLCTNMSWLNKAFGAPKQAVKANSGNQQRNALDGLAERIEVMEKKIEHLGRRGMDEQKKAKAFGTKTATNKQKAMMCLRRFKGYEKEVKMLEGTLVNMEAQKSALEMSMMTAENIQAMKAAGKSMKNNVDVDEAQNVMDDIADQLDAFTELVDVMAAPMAGQEELDEDELDAFLEMEGEEEEGVADITSTLTDLGPMPDVPDEAPMPAVPTTAPQITGDAQEDAQLAELTNWMD